MSKARVAEAIEALEATEVTVRGVDGFFEKVVTRFGTGAKIDCPKKYLGRTVFVVVRRTDGDIPESPDEPFPQGELPSAPGVDLIAGITSGGSTTLASGRSPPLLRPNETPIPNSQEIRAINSRRGPRSRSKASVRLSRGRPMGPTVSRDPFRGEAPLSVPE